MTEQSAIRNYYLKISINVFEIATSIFLDLKKKTRKKNKPKQSPGCWGPVIYCSVYCCELVFWTPGRNEKVFLDYRWIFDPPMHSLHQAEAPAGSPGHRLNSGEHLPTSAPLSPSPPLFLVITSYLRQIWNPCRDLLAASCSRVKTRWFVSTERAVGTLAPADHWIHVLPVLPEIRRRFCWFGTNICHRAHLAACRLFSHCYILGLVKVQQ